MTINLRELLKERVARGIGTGGGLLNMIQSLLELIT